MNNHPRHRGFTLAALVPAFTFALLLTSTPSLAADTNTSTDKTTLQSSEDQAKAAVSRFKKASNAGDAEATRMLGDAYRNGKGVTKDTAAAFALYAEAARAGDATARLRMGESYHRGQGTDSNQISAWVWLTLASENDSSVKEQALTLRNVVEQSLSDAQKGKAAELVEGFKKMMQP